MNHATRIITALVTLALAAVPCAAQDMFTITKETKLEGMRTVLSMADGTSFDVRDPEFTFVLKVTMVKGTARVGDPNGAFVVVPFPITIPSFTEISFHAAPGKAIVVRGKP